MSEEEVTNPGFKLPSATGIVANAGTVPEPAALIALKDLWAKRDVRDALAAGLYWVLGRIVPGAAQSIVLKEMEPHITAIIRAGSK